MTAYILIVVSLTTWNSHLNYGQRATSVTMQEFGSVKACRSAADEIARQNNNHSTLRMSCVPKDHP